MSDTKTTIELNGKRYNPVTGQLIDHSTPKPAIVALSHSNVNHMQHAGRSIDGFTRKPAQSQPQVYSAAPTQHKRIMHASTKSSHPRHPAVHAVHHAPQRSKTLMRTAVKKPAHNATHATHRTDIDMPATLNSYPTPSHMHAAVNEERVKRAVTINKSNLVSKFNFGAQPVEKKTSHMPVKPEPLHNHLPVISNVSAPIMTEAPTGPIVNSFHQALTNIPTHHTSAHNKRPIHHRIAHKLGLRGRTVTIASSLMAIVVLSSFIAYQNMPNLSLRLAAAKAGFNASMPGYKPSGFALAGPIHYGPGEITITYKSADKGLGYKVSQRPSQWNSETLLGNFVATRKEPYQTYQEKGRTIYIYDGANATWVNGGIWYQINADPTIASNQLLRIASSL